MSHLHAALLATLSAVALYVVLACDAPKQPAAAPPPPPPAAQPNQCGRDADCKGDRICDHGQCVTPR